MPMGSFEVAENYERELRKDILQPRPEKKGWTTEEKVMLWFLIVCGAIVVSLAVWGHKFCLLIEAL